MALELVPTTRDHSDEVARICHEAYKDLTDRHHFPGMFPSTGVARQVFSRIVESKISYGVTAMLDGQPIGSAFAHSMDEVIAIGPVSVEPAAQGSGAAKAMMRHLIEFANAEGYDKIRLGQRAYNPVSLSLYASLGFDVIESVMEMTAAPEPDTLEAVRPYADDDLGAISELSKRYFKLDRSGDIKSLLDSPDSTILVRERENTVTGYLGRGPGVGHGVGEEQDDLLALVGELAIRNPGAKIHCPLSNGSLYRKLLKAGCRAVEVHTLMARGPYEQPEGAWLPSGTY